MKKVGKTLITLTTLAFLGLGALSFGLRENAIGAEAADITDNLTSADFAATSTTYTAFTGVTKNLAVYAGKTSKSANGFIQIRSKNSDCGIVSTTSGGTIKSVTISFSSDGTDYNGVQLYGSNAAYTNATDLYDATTQGVLLGTFSVATVSTDVTINVGDPYEYVGIRSASGARYVEKVVVTWAEFDPLAPTVKIDQSGFEGIVGTTGTLTATKTNDSGAPVVWSSSDSTVISINSSSGAYECHKIGSAELIATITVGGVDYRSKIVSSVTGTLTAQEAYTIAQALASGAQTSYKVTVGGIVASSAGTGLSNVNNSINLSAGAGQFVFYIGYNAVSNWAEVSVVGSLISSYGYIKNYNGTFELVEIVLVTLIKSADAIAVESFINVYMHPEIPYTNNSITGACLGETGYYQSAKTVFNSLSASRRQLFVQHADYTNPYARLVAWANANGEVFNSTDNTFAPGLSGSLDNNVVSNSKVIQYSVIIAIIGLTSLGSIYFYRKRKITE